MRKPRVRTVSQVPQVVKWWGVGANAISLPPELSVWTSLQNHGVIWSSVYWLSGKKETVPHSPPGMLMLLGCDHSAITSAPATHFGAHIFFCVEFPPPSSDDYRQQWKCADNEQDIAPHECHAPGVEQTEPRMSSNKALGRQILRTPGHCLFTEPRSVPDTQ